MNKDKNILEDESQIEKLNESSQPQRLSKTVIILIIAFFSLVVGLILYGIFDSSEKQQAKTDANKELQSFKGSNMSDDFLSSLENRTIEDDQSESQLKENLTDENKTVIKDKEEVMKLPEPMVVKTEPSPEEVEADQRKKDIERMKMQALTQALNSTSKAQYTPLQNNKLNENNPDDLLSALGGLNELDNIANIADKNKDIDAMVQEQIASLTGGNNTVKKEKYESFANDEWSLNNKVEKPHSKYEVRAGVVIPAVLVSGINSDLPGQITALVTQNVYDTATGKYLLVPQGTRLIGAYSSSIAYGQERIMVAWQRLVFPDSKVLNLGAMPGSDMSGYAGFKDQVNNHWGKLLSSAFLMSGITAAVSIGSDSKSSGFDENLSLNDELRKSMATQFGEVITRVIEKNLNIAPTIEIRPGYKFNVTVTKDLNFKKPYQMFDF